MREMKKKENVVFDRYPVHKVLNYEKLKNIYKYSCMGYAKCYIEQPYGLSAKNEVINQLFFDLNEVLFYDFKYPVYIYLWDENCSNYFEAGKEWWGAYLWTVLIKDRKEIVVILASSTD